MDWLTAFQQSLREPVFGFLSAYWPFIAAAGLALAGWYFSDAIRNRLATGDTLVGGGDGEADGDGGGDGGGGDAAG